jgi:hypothetical protein
MKMFRLKILQVNCVESNLYSFFSEAATSIKEVPTVVDNSNNSMLGEPILTSQLVLTNNPTNTSDLVRQLVASRRYHCPACSYQAVKLSNVERHLAAVHQGARHCCPDCAYSASKADLLRRHRARHHPGVQEPEVKAIKRSRQIG